MLCPTRKNDRALPKALVRKLARRPRLAEAYLYSQNKTQLLRIELRFNK